MAILNHGMLRRPPMVSSSLTLDGQRCTIVSRMSVGSCKICWTSRSGVEDRMARRMRFTVSPRVMSLPDPEVTSISTWYGRSSRWVLVQVCSDGDKPYSVLLSTVEGLSQLDATRKQTGAKAMAVWISLHPVSYEVAISHIECSLRCRCLLPKQSIGFSLVGSLRS